MKAETGVMLPGAKEGQQYQEPGERPGAGSPSEPPEGTSPTHTLILDLILGRNVLLHQPQENVFRDS